MHARKAVMALGSGRRIFFLTFNAANVLNYAFLLAMSRVMAGDDFALFASLFGAVYFASALANTVMTATAAGVAARPDAARAIVARGVRRLALLGVPLALAVTVAARPAGEFLHSGDFVAIALGGASLWLLVVASVGYGGLQGGERFGLLGAALIVAAGGRVVLGLAFVGAGMGVDGAMLGIALGLAASAALALASFARRAAVGDEPFAGPTRDIASMLPALIASIAIAIPTSADVVLVRHYFSAEDTGAYAAVSTLGKVVVFGPLAVSLALFPSLVREHARGSLRSGAMLKMIATTAAVAIPSACLILGAWSILPRVILARYNVSFALIAMYLGAMVSFSLLVSLVYLALARRDMATIAAVPVGLAIQLALIAAWHPSTAAVAAVLMAGNLMLLAGVGWRCGSGMAGSRTGAAQPVFGMDERMAA